LVVQFRQLEWQFQDNASQDADTCNMAAVYVTIQRFVFCLAIPAFGQKILKTKLMKFVSQWQATALLDGLKHNRRFDVLHALMRQQILIHKD